MAVVNEEQPGGIVRDGLQAGGFVEGSLSALIGDSQSKDHRRVFPGTAFVAEVSREFRNGNRVIGGVNSVPVYMFLRRAALGLRRTGAFEIHWTTLARAIPGD